MHASLTRRYLIALGIIATLLVFSYAASRQFDIDAHAHAELINTSGQQRMWSQRIAMLGLALVETRAVNQRAATGLVQSLNEAISGMRANQLQLGSDWAEWQHSAVAFDLPALDARISEFLARAEKLLDENSIALARIQANALLASANSDFLPALDAIVSHYQQQAEDAVHAAVLRKRLQVAFGLLVLLAEVLFIFRPMVASTVDALQQLRRSNGRLRDVGYRLSHDLRAPVASSLGLVSLAGESLDESDVPEARFALGEIGRSLEGLDRYIGEMNRVVRHPQVAAAIATLDIDAQVDKALAKLAHMPRTGRLTITTDVPSGLVWTGEGAVLVSVLENLLSNAIKYTDPDCDAPRVEIRARRRGSVLVVDVDDNGMGVPEDKRDSLFKRFERCHPERAVGTGLGLYLAREAAERLSGTLEHHALPEGSRFRLSVPDDIVEEELRAA